MASDPEGLAFDSGNGDLYVSNLGSNAVTVIDGSTNAVITSVPVGAYSTSVAYDSANGQVFVAGPYYVSVIDGTTNSLVATIGGQCEPLSLAYDSDNGNIYVANWCSGYSTSVNVISGATDADIGSVSVGAGPDGVAYDSANGDVYVANYVGGTVSVVDGATESVIATVSPPGPNPWGVAYDAENGDVYVTNSNGGSVSAISGASNTVVATISVGPSPIGIATDNGNGDVYVANEAGGLGASVSVVDGTNQVVVATIDVGTGPNGAGVGGTPDGVAYDGWNGAIYVSYATFNSVSVISTLLGVGLPSPDLRGLPGTGSVLTPAITVGQDSLGVAVDPDTGYVYVSNEDPGTLSKISGSTNTVVANVPAGTDPWGVTYDGGNGDLYVADAGGAAVSVINGATNAIVATVAVQTDPLGIAYDAGNGEIYVSNQLSHNVSVISGTTNQVVATIPVGVWPEALAYDSANGEVYVPNFGSNNVSVIDGATNAVVATITAGGAPDAVAYDSENSEVYILNGAGSVSVVDGTTNAVVAGVGVGNDPYGIAYDSSNGDVYVANTGGPYTMSVIDGTTNTVVATISQGIGAQPYGVAYDPANGDVYVVDYYNPGSVNVISTLEDPSVPSTATMDVGQDLLLSAPITGEGTGNLTMTMSSSSEAGLPCSPDPSGFEAMSGSCLGLLAGTFTVTMSLVDTAGSSVVASTTVTVLPDPALSSPTASPASVDLGQSSVLATAASGGSGGYEFNWTGLPSGCASTNSAGLVCEPSEAGANFNIIVNLTDSDGFPVQSSPLSFTVYPDPTLAPPASSASSVDVGQSGSVTFSAGSLTGGTGTITSYAWADLPSGCTGTATVTVTCPGGAFVAPGLLLIETEATDSNGETSAWSAPLLFAVNGPLSAPAPAESAPSGDVGQSVVFSASVSGGAGGYAYSWTGLLGSCTSPLAPTVSCTLTLADVGVHASVQYSVTDADSMVALSPTISFTVYEAPSIGLPSGSVPSADVGQTVLFSVAASGGTGEFPSFSWTGLPGLCSGTSTSTPLCVVETPGTFVVSAGALDSNGESTGLSLPISFTVYADPEVATPVASSPSADVAQPAVVSFSETGTTGGTGTFPSYAWTGLPTGCSGTSSSVVSCPGAVFVSVGSLAISVVATDSNGVSSPASPTLLFTVYPDPIAPAPTSSAASADVGQSVTFLAASTGGSGGDAFVWSGLLSSCVGVATASPSCTVAAADVGSHPAISYTVTDSDGFTSASPTLSFTAYTDPSVSSPSSSASGGDVGQSVTFSTLASGGTGTYPSYQWSGLPGACTGASSATATCYLTAPIATSVTVVVVDSDGRASLASSPLAFTVDALPSVGTPTSSLATLDVGEAGSVVFAAGALAGGSGTVSSYAWSGLPAGCSGTTTASVTCSGSVFVVAGSDPVAVEVTDSQGGISAWSAPLLFTVYSDPSATPPVLNATSLDVGQWLGASETPTGGSGGYTYAWSGLPPSSCTGLTTAAPSCQFGPGTQGAWTASVVVTDSNDVASRSSGSVGFFVYADPVAATPTANRSSADPGQEVSFSTSVVGGTGLDTFAWQGLPLSGCSAVAAPTVSCTLSTPGALLLSVTVTDSNGIASTSGTLSFTVNGEISLSTPTASVSGASNVVDADVGQSVTLATDATGGSGVFVAYVWTGLSGVDCVLGENGPEAVCTFSVAGTFMISSTVTDSLGESARSSGILTLTVLPSVTGGELGATSTAIDLGQSTTFTAAPQGGSGAFTTTWNDLPAGCAGTTPVLVCTPTVSGSFLVSATVTDSNGESATTSSKLLTVSPPLTVSAFADPASPVVGTSTELFAIASGGTGPLAYAWTFGDGAGGNGNSVSHTYATPGTLTATVVVSDAAGATATASVILVIASPGSSAPSVLGTSPQAGWAIIGLLILVAVLIVVTALTYLARRPGSPSGERESPPHDGPSSPAKEAPSPDEKAADVPPTPRPGPGKG